MTNRDWGGLKTIIDQAREDAEEEKRNPSPACPVCGEILDVRPRDGMRNCPLGHYRDNGRPPGGN